MDPNATGLLVVLINEATKLSNYLLDDVKEYLAEVILGVSTTTEDQDGEIVEEMTIDKKIDDQLDDILNSFIGKQKQTPPMYSAIKQQGKKLYELARKGMVVERESREIEIYSIVRKSPIIYQNNRVSFDIYTKVSKGTYIRTLCVDIGKKMNLPAHMGSLKRVASGSLKIEDSYYLDDVKMGNFRLISMLESLKKYHQIEVDGELKKKICNGVTIDINELNGINEEKVVFKNEDQLIGIYRKEEGKYRAERVWKL